MQSVNTIIKKNNKIIGANTDIHGFETSLSFHKYELKNKKVFILGAGGVVPSIIYVLKKEGVSRIALSNRTKKNTDNLKKIYPDLEIIDWGQTTEFDMIINATSLGLKDEDKIELDFNYTKAKHEEYKGGLDIKRRTDPPKFFYDLIYKKGKKQTDFILKGKKLGHKTQDGSLMFVYQAMEAFGLWGNENDCDWNSQFAQDSLEFLDLINF